MAQLSNQTQQLLNVALSAADAEAQAQAQVAADNQALATAQVAVLAAQAHLGEDQAQLSGTTTTADQAAIAFFQSAAADLGVSLPLTVPALAVSGPPPSNRLGRSCG